MNNIQNYIILLLLFISCGVQEKNVIIKDDLLKIQFEEFERSGYNEASLYIRINNDGNRVLIVANHNLRKCEIYKSTGKYKSIQIQFFADSRIIEKDYKGLFEFPVKSECIQFKKNEVEVAPDSDMIYEYEITANGLVKLGKW